MNELAAPQGPSRKPIWTRRLVLVDKGFQLRYAALLAVVGAGAAGLCGGLVYAARRRTILELPVPSSVHDELSRIDAATLTTLIGVVVMCAVLLFVAGIVITHRVAGPIYVMTRSLCVLAEGKYPTLRTLRRGDELKDAFELFHKSVDFLWSRELANAYKLKEALVRLEAKSQDPEIKAALETLETVYSGMKHATERLEKTAQLSTAPKPTPVGTAIPAAATRATPS
jgi:hypothetical protein